MRDICWTFYGIAFTKCFFRLSFLLIVTNTIYCQQYLSCRMQEITIKVSPIVSNLEPNNLLSANGDGVNDVWVIKNLEQYPANQVTIFDKGGRIVYRKKGYTNNWDGSYNGAPLNEDTYYYVLDPGNNKPSIKGFITLIRDRK